MRSWLTSLFWLTAAALPVCANSSIPAVALTGLPSAEPVFATLPKSPSGAPDKKPSTRDLETRSEEKAPPLTLLPAANASSAGIYLADLITNRTAEPLPRILLAPAPAIGRPVTLTRIQIAELLKKSAPELAVINWSGAERIRISRAVRNIDESALKMLLTGALQQEVVKDRGDLELTFTRPWNSVVAPDDPLTLKVIELPLAGVTPNFVCRFELIAGQESIGTYQQPVQARIWQDVYVAKSTITRGALLKDADVSTEKRDILTLRDGLTGVLPNDPNVEFRENVMAGAPLAARMFRMRAIIKRGKLVDALVQDDTMTISLKAEALEDGVRGQMVRLRNPRSRREFKGKVEDEQTVVVLF